MIKHRTKEITVGITLALAIPMFLFFISDVDWEPAITGLTIYEKNVIISGTALDAVIDDITYYYIFNEDGWHESKDLQNWEKRNDMGDNIWTGLYYLQSYNAEIYFKNEKINDMEKFLREWK